ncbi:MAG: hypothetical protein GY928_35870 [Colwellia sp.]|nr:hypothetical protein [Colwellia sp.]
MTTANNNTNFGRNIDLSDTPPSHEEVETHTVELIHGLQHFRDIVNGYVKNVVPDIYNRNFPSLIIGLCTSFYDTSHIFNEHTAGLTVTESAGKKLQKDSDTNLTERAVFGINLKNKVMIGKAIRYSISWQSSIWTGFNFTDNEILKGAVFGFALNALVADDNVYLKEIQGHHIEYLFDSYIGNVQREYRNPQKVGIADCLNKYIGIKITSETIFTLNIDLKTWHYKIYANDVIIESESISELLQEATTIKIYFKLYTKGNQIEIIQSRFYFLK